MILHRHAIVAGVALLLSLTLTFVATGQEESNSSKIQWQGPTLSGESIQIPENEQVSLVVFAMVDQDRSQKALEQLGQMIGDGEGVRPILVVSGVNATINARRLKEQVDVDWPVAVDPEYELSSQFHVRAWPTVGVVKPDGTLVHVVAGLPSTLTRQVRAHLDLARGRLSEDELKQRLESPELIEDSPAQQASRHIQVAERMMRLGQYAQAARELEQAFERAPDHPLGRLLDARLKCLTGDPAAAMQQLDRVDASAVPGWRLKTLRGRALVALGEWSRAEQALEQAVQLNPQPAEAQYLLGRVHEHFGRWEQASRAYRASFEHIADADVISRE